MRELNLEELEKIDGGADWDFIIGGGSVALAGAVFGLPGALAVTVAYGLLMD